MLTFGIFDMYRERERENVCQRVRVCMCVREKSDGYLWHSGQVEREKESWCMCERESARALIWGQVMITFGILHS